MPLAIAIIAGIIIGLWLLAVVFFTAPVWLGAIVGMLLALHVYAYYVINAWITGKKQIDVLTVNFTGEKLEWHVEEAELKSTSTTGAIYATIIGLIVACVIAYIIVIQTPDIVININKNFFDLAVPGAAVCAIVLTTGFYSTRYLKSNLMEKLGELGSRANWSLGKLKDLQALESELLELSAALKLQFRPDFRSGLQVYADSNKAKLLANSKELEDLVEKAIAQACDDKAQLQKTVSLYETANQILVSITRKMVRKGRSSLVGLMDEYTTVLSSDHLKSLIIAKQWSDVEEILNEIITELKNMDAMNIDDIHDYVSQKSDDEEPMSDEKACRTLNIPEGSTMQQIEQMYRRLRSLWHTDKGMTEDRKKFQAIQEAYMHLIRKKT